MVGVIAVPGLEVVVEPKVPLSHLLYLFERSGQFPRLDTTKADLQRAESLWPLLAAWFINCLERLLHAGLANGYRHERGELGAARGRIEALATARLLTRGRARLMCEYEEFDADIPINRVVRAAALAVAGSKVLDHRLRQRSMRLLSHMEGVGQLMPSDLRHEPERSSARYMVPWKMALHVLRATGRGINVGAEHGWAFLIRTPEMVEEALRRIIGAALTGHVQVVKKGRRLRGSIHTLTPDLCFGDLAIGDVKYKLWSGDWDRADLYQLVAFATGFGVTEALRAGFLGGGKPGHSVEVGQVTTATIDWPSISELRPEEAEEAFIAAARTWWARVLESEPALA